MENRGWLKLWRKIDESDIFNDEKALRLFIYLLSNVNKNTGAMKIGRFWLADRLNEKPGTLYSTLKRLEKKYKITTQISNNKFTEIRIINWQKYQDSNNAINNKSTTNQQQINTLQDIRYKNKELAPTVGVAPLHRSLAYLKELPLEDLTRFNTTYQASKQQVLDKAEGLALWCEAKGKKPKDYRATLQGALLRDYGKRTNNGYKRI